LPFEEMNDPFELQQQTIKGQIKISKEGIDPAARDLMNKIFILEPNMRFSLASIKQHRFFVQDWQTEEKTPEKYWSKVKAKTMGEPPYKPNPLKFKYLLQNEYEKISNLQCESPMLAKDGNHNSSTGNEAS